MLVACTAREAEFHDECFVSPPGTLRRWAWLAAEHLRDQLDESPVARLDGVAHQRRGIPGV